MDGDHRHHLPPLLPAAAAAAVGPWPCLLPSQEKEELRRALLRASLELESTRAAAQEELVRLENHALHLARLLEAAARERDEARAHCHSLLLLLLEKEQQQQPLQPPPPLAEACAPDSSSSESSNAAASPAAAAEAELEAAAGRRKLPERGRLVEAVMAAGPLLQTLLVAGPLPRWRRPPPALKSSEIPPVPVGAAEPGRWEAALSPSPPPALNYSCSSSSPENNSRKLNRPA